MRAHLLWHLLNARCYDVVQDDTLQLVEPEEREFREDATFVRNALAIQAKGVISICKRFGVIARRRWKGRRWEM